MRRKISVCIPVYNEAGNLPQAVAEVERLFASELKGYELEIIVTDNASTDATWQVVQELARSRSHLKGYRFSRNFGYQNSVFAGLSLATGDAVVELDADLEDPPAVIAEFAKHWAEGAEVVIGLRRKRHAPPIRKLLFSAFYKVLNAISDIPIPENAGDFRLLDRRVVDVLKSLPERNLYIRGLVAYVGFRQVTVLYDRNPRLSGSSKFRLMHYMALAMDALTAFSKTPLRLMSILGFCLLGASLLAAGYYVVHHIRVGTPIPGFTTLIVATLFLHSVTFIFLGVIGEYLSRIFDDAKSRPRVLVAECTDGRNSPFAL